MKRNPVRILAAAILAALSLPAASKLDVPGLDRGIDPCTDFYGYANRIGIASCDASKTLLPDIAKNAIW